MFRVESFVEDSVEDLKDKINYWIYSKENDYYDQFKLIDIKIYEPGFDYKALLIYEMVEKGDRDE